MLDIRHPAFAGGAKADNVTDIGPALQAAWDALPPTGGEILLPCSPGACYWPNPNNFHWVNKGTVTWFLQGQLRTGTTLTIPRGIALNIIGKGAGGTAQFQSPGESALISVAGKSASGMLGTAVSTPDGKAASVTFTPSTTTGLYPGTAVTVAGALTCNISKVTRKNNNVTASFSSPCHIPAGVVVSATGVADGSFNGTHTNGAAGGPFMVTDSDYPAQTLSWIQAGQDASSSGGTVTGLNEDTVEDVQITATTSKTATATFYRSHAATDRWSVVGVNLDNDTTASVLKDFSISSPGTGLWIQQSYESRIVNLGITSTSACGSDPRSNIYSPTVDVGLSTWIHFEGVAFDSFCEPWSIHMQQPYDARYADDGPIYVDDSFILGGIKQDHGGMGVFMRNSVCDQCARGVVSVDTSNYWNGNANVINIENTWLQDNPNGWSTCWVYQLAPGGAGVSFSGGGQGFRSCTVNDYFSGSVIAGGGPYDQKVSRGVLGTMLNGRNIDAEIRGEGASMSPSLIPFVTSNVGTDPASWGGTGASYCGTTSTTVLAPDGTRTAGSLVQKTGTFDIVGGEKITPVAGDMILFGGWAYTANHGSRDVSAAFFVDNGSSPHFTLSNGGSGTYQKAMSDAWDTMNVDDWWHPVVGFTSVTSTDGAANQVVRLGLSCDSTRTMNYWNPWMMYIPASAGIPLAEVMRWRQQLMHGAVPPNYNGPGIPATNEQIAARGYDLVNPAGGKPVPVIPGGLTGYSIDGGAGAGDTLAIAQGRFARSTKPVCPNGANGQLTTLGCSGSESRGRDDRSESDALQNGASTGRDGTFPRQVAHVAQTGLTGDGIGGTVYTASVAGTYRISFTIYLIRTGTHGNIEATVAYNTGSAKVTSGYEGSAAADVLTSPGYYQVVAHVGSGQDITYQTHFESVTGRPAYGIDIVVEQLQ